MELWVGGILLVLRLMIPGWIWTWRVAGPIDHRETDTFQLQVGRAVAAGLLLNLLPILALSAGGVWTPLADWTLWGLGAAAGGVRLIRTGGLSRLSTLRFAGTVGLTGLVTALVLFLPPRSEWLAGGWDPGIYVNQAVSIANHNGTCPVRDTVYADMTVAEREWVSTQEGSDYHEVFPGVPVSLEDGSLPVYFFHLTPVCGAWLYRLGGMGLLHRMPLLLALLGVLPAWAMLGALGLSRITTVAALVFWVLSPLWVYHQAIPSSEMLQVFLLCAGLLFYLDAARLGKSWPVLAGLALFAGTANRFDYPVFAGWFFVVAAAAEAAACWPGWQRRVGLCLSALALGLVWNVVFAWVTLARLHEKDQVLWIVLVPFAVWALAVSALVRWRIAPSFQKQVGRIVRVASFSLLVAVAGVWLLLWAPATQGAFLVAARRLPLVGSLVLALYRLLPFHGLLWLLAGVGGGMALATDQSAPNQRLRLVALALGGGVVALLLHGGIAAIYPWALRRPMVLWIPFMALVQGYGAGWVREKWVARRWVWAVVGSLLLMGALWNGARISRVASRVGDYRGMTAWLESITPHIQPEDVVVADDPLWGTPLLLAAGRDVVNGKLLWNLPQETRCAEFLAMLQRLQYERHGRILWLTSTPSGLDIYPFDLGSVVPLFENRRFGYPTVIHSPRGNHFATRENEQWFSLYSGQPGTAGGRSETAESE